MRPEHGAGREHAGDRGQADGARVRARDEQLADRVGAPQRAGPDEAQRAHGDIDEGEVLDAVRAHLERRLTDLAAIGVRVNTIAPGTIGTPPMMMMPEAMRDVFANNVPFPKRLGEPDEYAFLAQHMLENAYLNGQVIRLDGAVRFKPK